MIFDEPHPLRFDGPRLRDYLDTALRWLAAAHAQDSGAIYPLIFWNCLPKGGASQMHGHMQLALAPGMHYARVELWRRAAQSYRAEHGARYFDDLFAVHQALGLAIPSLSGTRAFAHLTPLRNREIVLLASPSLYGGASVPPPLSTAAPTTDKLEATIKPQNPCTAPLVPAASVPALDALHAVLRNLIDRAGHARL